jgi:hypothetical protein
MPSNGSIEFYLLFIFLVFLLMAIVFGKGDKKANKNQSSYSSSNDKKFESMAKIRTSINAKIENMKDRSSVTEAADLVDSHFEKNNNIKGAVGASYILIFTDLCKEYEKEIKNCLKEIKRTDEHYEMQLRELKEEILANDWGEEEEKYQLKSYEDDYKEELKSEQKLLKWYERELAKIRSDHSWLIKKYVAASNRESKEWGFFISPDSLMQLDLPKEPPDSLL